MTKKSILVLCTGTSEFSVRAYDYVVAAPGGLTHFGHRERR